MRYVVRRTGRQWEVWDSVAQRTLVRGQDEFCRRVQGLAERQLEMDFGTVYGNSCSVLVESVRRLNPSA